MRDELLSAIYADPASDAARAVYGDWLLERGHPLGQLIQLQLARAGGKKGTKAKEERLLAEHGKTFWPEHPAAIGHVPSWSETERGFPMRFSQPLPVSEGPRREEVERWRTLTGNPAWATIREVVLPADAAPDVVERLLLGSTMPLLEVLDGIGSAAFARVASTDLPVRRVNVSGPPFELPAVSGLPRLRELEIVFRTSLATAIDAFAATGLRDRLERLELRGCSFEEESFAVAPLRVLADLPETVAEVDVALFYGRGAIARRGEHGPSLEVALSFHDLDSVAASLRGLERSRVASVHVVFAEGGFFTKKNLAPSERLIEEATAHLPAATFSWSKKSG